MLISFYISGGLIVGTSFPNHKKLSNSKFHIALLCLELVQLNINGSKSYRPFSIFNILSQLSMWNLLLYIYICQCVKAETK